MGVKYRPESPISARLNEGFVKRMIAIFSPDDPLAYASHLEDVVEEQRVEIERLRGALKDILELAEQDVIHDTKDGYELRLANLRGMARAVLSVNQTEGDGEK